ncbi:hypothetical protein [Virgibacillus sp. Bac332]|uniref:hypothetical protein n=1 Tax=Virgibacillus sp. Bac332 TaxID=2419842 RepID=UPI000EF4C467|nr:hypothetical protein [Virgibacillus sp. Bac332]
MIEDSARYLNVTDIELIHSWEPHEYKILLKGAQHKQIDQYEYMAKQAMAHGYASRAKKPSEKRIFNAKKARMKLETGKSYDPEEMKRSARMNRALKGFKPQFIPDKKGGR